MLITITQTNSMLVLDKTVKQNEHVAYS